MRRVVAFAETRSSRLLHCCSYSRHSTTSQQIMRRPFRLSTRSWLLLRCGCSPSLSVSRVTVTACSEAFIARLGERAIGPGVVWGQRAAGFKPEYLAVMVACGWFCALSLALLWRARHESQGA